MKRGNISIDTMIIMIILIAFLVAALIYLGVFRGHTQTLLQQIIDFLTGS